MTTGCFAQPEPEDAPPFATEEEAFAAAEETYRAYVDALNQVDLSDPETFEDVYAWTTGDLNAEDRRTFSEMHAKSWSVGGESILVRIDHQSASDEFAEVNLGACVDVSGVSLTDESGASQVTPDRPAIQSTTVTVVQSASPTGYLVADVQGAELDPPC